MRTVTLAFALTLALAGAGPARAQNTPSPKPAQPSAAGQQQPAPAPGADAAAAPAGRYVFNRVDAAVLRLDTVTGEVTYCRAQASGWACEAVPQNRAALEKEVAQLKDEVAALKKEIAALREPPPTPRPQAPVVPPPAAKPGDQGMNMPSGEDLARARAYIEETWRRLVDMIDQLQKDMTRKPDRDGGLSRT